MPNPEHDNADKSIALGNDQPWLAGLLVPIFGDLQSARADLQAALKQAEEARTRAEYLTAQYENLRHMAEPLGYTPEQVDAFCMAEWQRRVHEASLPPEALGKRRVSNYELMVLVGQAIRNSGHPLNIDQIMAALEQEDIYLPGKEPRKNLLAYLSRSPIIRSTKKGWYTFDPSLLEAAERQVEASRASLPTVEKEDANE